jgi:hypothetical protein
VDVNSIIQYDEQFLLESSSLVRESNEIFNNYIFPLFKEWIFKKGQLSVPDYNTPSPASKEAIPPEFNPDRWRLEKPGVYDTCLEVPSYWSIPALRGKHLFLSVTIQLAPGLSNMAFGGMMNHDKNMPTLKVQIHCPEYTTRALEVARVRVRSVIAHELEHYLDVNTDQDNPLSKKAAYSIPGKEPTMDEIVAYYIQPVELRAKVREIAELAKQQRKPIQPIFDELMQEILMQLCGSKDLEDDMTDANHQKLDSSLKKIELTFIKAIRQRYPKVKLKRTK